MNSFNHHPSRIPGRLTILAIAIASTLVVGQVQADTMGATNSGNVTLLENSATFIGGTAGFVNTSGTIDTLNNSGSISGSNTGINNQGTILSLNNSTAGRISSSSSGISINNNGTIGALNNSGSISSANEGINNQGTIVSLNNSTAGSISSTSNGNGINNNNNGAIGTLSNSGSISGYNAGINNQGAITTLNNSGTISSGTSFGYGNGINNEGIIDTLNNSGTISSGGVGIENIGLTNILTNSNLISGGVLGIQNYGTITALNNAIGGTISGDYYYGIENSGRIDTLTNSGLIKGVWAGVYTYGTITALNNTVGGTISGGGVGINNSGQIDILINSGLINGGARGIQNYGTISALDNATGGTISGGTYAIYNSSNATLGTVTNSGIIAGTIQNDSSNVLTINGGSGSTFGLLTGFSAGTGISDIGLLTNTHSNLVFGSGNLILNDNIDVGTFAVANTGATLQVNNSININGNYNQGTNASLILGVGSNPVTTTGVAGTNDGYGRLVVSGTANIDSGSTVGLKQLGTYGFAQGQRYVVVQANTTGTNYNASTLHYTAAGYNVAGATVVGTSVVDGSHTNLLLTLGSAIPITPITPPETTPTSYAPINQATSTGGNATLAGLFNYGGYNAGLMNLFNAGAALDSSAAGNRAGAQLSPTSNLTAATQASTAATVQVLDVTAAHMDVLRTSQIGSSGVSTGESASSTGLWGQGFGGTSRLSERDDVAGYHAHYSGMLLGADAALNDSWRAGGVFSYTNSKVNNDGDNSGSSADVKSYGLFGYASYTGSPWYVDMSLGAIQHQYDTTREINFPGFSGTAKGQHDGMQYIASVLAGYPIDLGPKMANMVLTPIAGLTYSTLRQDSYTEKDGGGAALSVNADNIGSLKSDLGAKLERSFGTPYGNVVPSAQLTWRHEYHDKGLQSVSNYAADTSGATSFTTTGAKTIADTGVLALGVTLMRSQNLSVGAKYTLEAASGYAANTGDVQVRWDF